MMFLYAYLLAFLQILLGSIGVSPALWSYMEARKDARNCERDPEDMQLTAQLRLRVSKLVLVTHLAYLLTGVMIVGLMFRYQEASGAHEDLVGLIMFIANGRTVIVQTLMLWLSIFSKKDRIRLQAIRIEEASHKVLKDRRVEDWKRQSTDLDSSQG